MLFLPAAALCCLCSALVAMAAELVQDQLSVTRRENEKVSFSCGRTDQCDVDWIFWYQKKDTETFRVILDVSSNGTIDNSYNHPQKDDFTAIRTQNGCELQIEKVQFSHAATYYCSCWKSGFGRYLYLIFGSGTKLFVTGEQVVKPVVSMYPAASGAQLEGKRSLLCVASAMFPPLVQFSWKRQKENCALEDLPPAEGEQLELRESGRAAAILLVDALHTYKYRCHVRHEGGTVEAHIEAGSCVPAQFQVKQLCLLYTVLTVKSLVYCCGLALLMSLRNKGPTSS